jgi:D-alanyl-D-alanine carboxypeptidase
MAITKRGIIVLGVAGGAVGLALITAGVVGIAAAAEANADAQAREAFDAATAEVETAAADRDDAISTLITAQQSALDARASAGGLVAAADPTLIADPATRDALTIAIESLTTTAELVVAADGSVTLPEPPAESRVPAIDQPVGREAILEAVDGVLALAEPLVDDTTAFELQADAITASLAAVDEAELAVVASAHAKGAATAAPELASQETKDAYSAAVAALEKPAKNADLVTLVAAYRDTWGAAVASNEEAVRAQDPVSIEPTYINGILIVNKTYALPSWFGDGLTAETQVAFASMQAEAATLGLDLYISSGFRSYGAQESIYNRYVANDGQAEADRYSARPGHSEHQSGLTFDLNTIDEAFAYTPAGEWVRDNAHRFGFVIRYPPGKEAITGYIWEPWHLRYLGEAVATELYTTGLSLEEYLGVTSQYG